MIEYWLFSFILDDVDWFCECLEGNVEAIRINSHPWSISWTNVCAQ